MKKCPICRARLVNSNVCINPECAIGKTAVFTLYKNDVKYILTKDGLVEVHKEGTNSTDVL